MKTSHAILFDLDGVLVDSRLPITQCMNEALIANGQPGRSTEELVPLVGPPIARAFAQLVGEQDDAALVAACVTAYRERYTVVSIRDAASFDGVPDAVAQLARRYPLAVATSKPLAFAEPLLDALELREHFAVVAGPDLATVAESKGETVARALAQLSAPARAVMVGDRSYDVVGARENGLPVVGVSWGLGSREELIEAGATAIIDAPAELAATVERLLHADRGETAL